MGSLAKPLPYSLIFKLSVMKKNEKGDKKDFGQFQPFINNASRCEIQKLYGQIVEEFLPEEERKIVIWLHLKHLLTQDMEGINWIMEAVEQMIDEAEAALQSPYQ